MTSIPMPTLIRTAALAALALAALASPPARAQSDHFNLEEGYPTRIEDAYATAYRNRELQLNPRYERQPDGLDLFSAEPSLEVGLFRNSKVQLSVPVRVGTADRTGSGNVRVEAFYNLNTEGLVLPAVAFAVEGEFSTGYRAEGVDGTFELLATKSIDNRMDRLHVNVEYTVFGTPGEDERDGAFAVAAGVSGRLGPDTVLILSAFREEERRRGEVTNVAELGLRRQITPRLVLSAGVGTGLDGDSPRFRGTFGVQRSF